MALHRTMSAGQHALCNPAIFDPKHCAQCAAVTSAQYRCRLVPTWTAQLTRRNVSQTIHLLNVQGY